ncbi:MAG: XdhC family protein, partial [Rhodospirillales bacterium]|nr:XdhC family protein [Rhodospirillales bacterium]
GRAFMRAYTPPRRLFLVGAVHIAQPLAPMAAACGWAVTIIDPRRAFATPERFPSLTLRHDYPDEAFAELGLNATDAVAALTHDPKIDDPALAAALRSPAFYIGALGSRRTHAQRLERLAARGFAADQLARIHGPIGLYLGGRQPAEIAVGILAQILHRRYRETRP